MTLSTRHAYLFWSCLQVLNRERYDALIKVFGTLEDAAKHVDGELLRGLGCREKTIGSVLERMEKCDPEQEEALLLSADARIICLGDQTYPDRLKDIPDAPVFLYAQGDLGILSQPSVGLVGTRKMSPYGRRITQEFTRALTQAKIVTVSGLARGVDSLVAEETMSGSGATIAILGQGLLTLPPVSAALAKQIVAAGGLILSEFPLRMGADMFTFPMRNRIIAGLSLATVVLEAPQSSGALITAKLAFEYGREVFAVPGQIFDANYAGCHAIIRKNQASIAASPRDVLEEIGVIVPDIDPDRVLYAPQNPEEENILKILTTMPQNIDELVQKSALTAGSLSAILTVLELNGAVRNLGAGQWVRT
ncbi:MAG: DNA-protecting protein DprA [Candidatus Peribacteraceae bacterium]|nr:DNA-protecting protein DprA [Candidatus Peribacteraceae bacterium]